MQKLLKILHRVKQSKFSKAEEYKINVQKSVEFVYMNNEQLKKGIKKKNSTQSNIKNNEILRNKFNKYRDWKLKTL